MAEMNKENSLSKIIAEEIIANTAMASKPPIALYRRILRLHRGLPEQVRLPLHRNHRGLCATSLATSAPSHRVGLFGE